MHRYSPRDLLVLGAIAVLFLWYTGFGDMLVRNPLSLVAAFIALAVGITVHEANHAWVATLLGDDTPRREGRVSLNPLRHLDPFGTLMIFVAHFGWGKPVSFNPWNLRVNPRLGTAMVAFAGPVANIVAAIVFLLAIRLVPDMDPRLRMIIWDPNHVSIVGLNIGLAAFNLIPIPPLDGFSVAVGVLPRPIAVLFEPLRNYGLLILMALFVIPSFGGPDLLRIVLSPIIGLISRFVQTVAFGF